MTQTSTSKPYWSLAGFWQGMRQTLPVFPGMLVFGLVVGTTAAHKGLSFIESAAMNLFVYAGVAQLVALDIWPAVFTWSAIATLTAVTAVVNARLFLMSASMQPWFGKLPPWQAYSLLYFLTDPAWLLSTRYRAEGGNDAAVYGGATVIILAGWMAASSIGYFAGALIPEPRRFGLDLAMPVFFAAMLFPLWRGSRRAIGWAVAGVVALAVQQFVPGYWFIVAGALAGSFAGALFDDTHAASAT